MPLAQFIQLHECPELAPPSAPRFAVLLARHRGGVVLVFSRFRQVWELPGGLIDPGETARQCAAREFHEETGDEAGELEWLGLLEVHDGSTHFGGVFRCTAKFVPEHFENQETVALASWTRADPPAPLGHSDAALLIRYG
jgi:8-oxo-dGTP pyrophosphatase MutT (NUDIX family)